MEQKTVIPGMPTVIPPGLTREQERAYIVQLQIEDLTRKLRTGDLGIPLTLRTGPLPLSQSTTARGSGLILENSVPEKA